MNRIEERFALLKEQNKKALITFVTAGDPDIYTTRALISEMERRGADLIELGVPYSDPVAEGPVIQEANARAMKNGISMKLIMETVNEIRSTVNVPIVLLLYFNCIFKYGMDRFFCDCAKYGIDGVIVPDIPFEERHEMDETAALHDVIPITLVAPTSRERIQKIVRNARGFLYCVSSLGVTGIRNSFDTDFNSFFDIVDQYTKIPKALGFGISAPEHIKQLKGYCDGLICGSAIVKRVGESINMSDAVNRVGGFVSQLRNALDNE